MRDGLGNLASNLPAALEARRHAHEMGAVFGGKMPASHAFIPGGFTSNPTRESIDKFRSYLSELTEFINDVYLPDVQAVGKVEPDHIGWSMELSPSVTKSLPALIEAIQNENG